MACLSEYGLQISPKCLQYTGLVATSLGWCGQTGEASLAGDGKAALFYLDINDVEREWG